MKNTVLCYIEKGGKYLMIHRTVRKNDGNDGKYLGIGGHIEEGESPYDAVIREVKEETSLVLNEPEYRGLVTFVSDVYETEQMHLFSCKSFSGELSECNEGELLWIEKSKLKDIDLWEGDFVFLEKLDTCKDFFSVKLVYRNEKLINAILYGAEK